MRTKHEQLVHASDGKQISALTSCETRTKKSNQLVRATGNKGQHSHTVRRGRNKNSELVRRMGNKGQHAHPVRRGRNNSSELVRGIGGIGNKDQHSHSVR